MPAAKDIAIAPER